VAQKQTVIVDSTLTTHFIPITAQLSACEDYEILVSATLASSTWNVWDPLAIGFSVPYDVGGVIRVNSATLGGAPNSLLPGITLIATSSTCDSLADLDPGGGTTASAAAVEVGAFVVPDSDLRTCTVGLEADLPVGSIASARVHESLTQVRGALIGVGSVLIGTGGLTTHEVPVHAALRAGQEYEVVVNFDGPATWNFYTGPALPYTVSPFDVVGGRVGGTPGADVPHVVLRWSDLVDREPLNILKRGDIFPPPLTGNAGAIDQGAVLSFGSDNHVFAFGLRADIPPGQTLTATVYEGGGAIRGPIISQGSSVSQSGGEQWHDVPIALNPTAADP
jgi:hypothetical protein